MPFTPRTLWYRVKIGPDAEGLSWVKNTSDVRISESVDQLCRVCEFDLSDQPDDEPASGDLILIEEFDFENDTLREVFGGTIDRPPAESQPWGMTIIATDQLRLLDRVRQGTDLNLTGMTPKQALMEVLDYVGCTYDPDDLADPDYVLGEREDVSWLVDTAGSQITEELSTVFGCVLMTIGNDRIVWLSHDSTPEDDTGSYGTYTRGTSIDFLGHGRSAGERSRIQNNWTVRGVTAQISKQCTAQAWAKAVGTNAQLGRRRRTSEQNFNSDLIQSEDLAEAIVRRLMRETNRLPDERTVPMVNDVNIHPTSKITIVDPTYGLGGTAYATVLAVERQGPRMTLRLSAGPGGSEGTVTTGVDKVCNDTHTDVNWPGDDFDFPDFDFPPIDLGDPIDFDLDLDIPPPFTPDGLGGTNVGYTPIGGTESSGECLDAIGPDDESDWLTDVGSAISIDGGVLNCDEGSSALNTAIVIGWDDDWHLTAVLEGSVVGPGTPEPWLGIVTNDSFGTGAFISMWDDGASFQAVSNGDLFDDFAAPWDVQSSMIWTLTRVGPTVFWSISQGSSHQSGSLAWDSPTETGDLAIRVYSSNGSLQVSNLQFCPAGAFLGPVIPVPGDWTIDFGTITFPTDGSLSFTDTDDAQASYDDSAGDVFPLTEETRVRWSGSLDATGTSEVFIGIYLMDSGNSEFAGIELLFSGSGNEVNFYSFAGFDSSVPYAFPDIFDFVIDWNTDSGLLSLWIDGDLVDTISFGTWSSLDLFPTMSHGTATTISADFTNILFVIGD